MKETKDLSVKEEQQLVSYDDSVAYGFEETKAEDIIIPRIKVIQALSPERVDGEANEGDVINSLTKENVAGKKFIPIKQYYTNIRWDPDRGADTRILCRSFDGKIGEDENGTLVCAKCRKNQFDNTKTGKAAQPTCTAYLNFLGFMEGEPMPVVLSFARTNYNEGKKLLSIAKSMRAAAWNYCYTLSSKKVTKDKQAWFIMTTAMAGKTSEEDRQLAFELFKAYESMVVKTDYEDSMATEVTATEVNDSIAEEI